MHFEMLLGIGIALVAAAWMLRGRFFAIFAGIIWLACALIWQPLVKALALPAAAEAVVQGLQVLVAWHLFSLTRPKLRSLGYRLLITWPALGFAAGTLLAWPWTIAVGLGYPPHGVWLPFVWALLGLWTSLGPRCLEEVHLPLGEALDASPSGKLRRVAPAYALRKMPPSYANDAHEASAKPLKIVQITDPHLGPFMSAKRLHEISCRAVAQDPDLILITGDLVTMESHTAKDAFAHALSPLAQCKGRVWACLGNHDHEAMDTVAHALDAASATLLVDEVQEITTRNGWNISLVGAQFRMRGRKQGLEQLAAQLQPNRKGPALWMVHDPGAFASIPDGTADMVFAGHTHGGHLGLVSLRLPYTVVGMLSNIPDHGLWRCGKNKLYVHRGTGHYGFPVRVGVPAEESVLYLYPPAAHAKDERDKR